MTSQPIPREEFVETFTRLSPDVQRAIATYEARLARLALERQSPAESDSWSFPADGGMEPIPAGTLTFDRKTAEIRAPHKIFPASAPKTVLDSIQSASVRADISVTLEARPGYGKNFIPGITTVRAINRRVDQLIIESAFPYVIHLALSNSTFPVEAIGPIVFAARGSDTTLTKSAAAGTADSFASLDFIPTFELPGGVLKDLDQALYGMPLFPFLGYTNIVFYVRNLDLANAVEIRVQGTDSLVISQPLTVLSLAIDWFQVSDIHEVGSTTEDLITVAALSATILESSLIFPYTRVQARVASAAAADQTARILIGVLGVSGPLR